MGGHTHNWKSLETEYPKFCACGAMRVPSMHSGKNSITIAAANVDLIRWSGTQAALALGDIGMNTTTGRPSMFVDGSARDWANSAVNNDSAPGLGLYGSGDDGSPSSPLGANTTLSAGDFVVRFANLDLNGFSLTGNSADESMTLYVSGTLTMNSGSIVSSGEGTNPAGGVGGGAAGDGGIGSERKRVVFLYANTISGTGTVRSNGQDGGNGNAGGTSTSTVNGLSGGGTNAIEMFNIQNGQSDFGGSGSFAQFGGSANTAPNVSGRTRSLARDLMRWFYLRQPADSVITSERGRDFFGAGGPGGGGGADRNGAITAGGGGGGGSGGSYLGVGGTGGAGGAGIGAVGGAGGGGGGGAGSGGTIYVVANAQSGGTLTIQVNGGSGGNGGGGGNSNAGNGAGGGGGSGGLATFVGPTGATVSMSSTGGSGGSAGVGGNSGAAGTSGASGLTMEIETEAP